MAIEELLQVIAPPDQPIETGDWQAWLSFQERMGIELPRDLYDVAMHYGTGWFEAGELKVYNPFSLKDAAKFRVQLGIMQSRRDSGLDYYDSAGDPFEIHPQRPGLFPWAADSNGNILCWLTDGEPEDWPVIFAPRDDDGNGKYPMSMTTFLAKALQGEVREPVRFETVGEEDRIFVQRP